MTVERQREKDLTADDEFAEGELEAGDENMFTDGIDTVKGWFGSKKAAAPADDPKIK